MRISALILASSAALTLAACGSETSGDFTAEDGTTGEYTVDRDTGELSSTIQTEDGEVSLRSGSDVPLNLPDGFSLMPGSEVLTNTVVSGQAAAEGSLITFRSDATPEAITDYYRQQAEAAGIEIQIETSMNGGKMIGGENAETQTTFSVTAYPDGEGGTTGQLTLGRERG